ncbi:MAG TPA: FAD-dependent monooxygenase, partial [Candidatus Dormibacteraeota bacterium]|nr:FAD-dependent monooxygenase [Candidatus Dormibacteraeota bacterium]
MADHSGVDVVIVGAGPVGSALAIALGRSGLQTVVLERDTFPRDKPCGEAIQPSGVAALAHLGIDLAAAGGWPLKGIRYRMPGHESVTASFGQERLGYGIPRRRLDELIAYAAASTPGVTVETSVEMTDLAVGPAGVTLETNRGSITTPVL